MSNEKKYIVRMIIITIALVITFIYGFVKEHDRREKKEALLNPAVKTEKENISYDEDVQFENEYVATDEHTDEDSNKMDIDIDECPLYISFYPDDWMEIGRDVNSIEYQSRVYDDLYVAAIWDIEEIPEYFTYNGESDNIEYYICDEGDEENVCLNNYLVDKNTGKIVAICFYGTQSNSDDIDQLMFDMNQIVSDSYFK